MPFTEEERRLWREEKRRREERTPSRFQPEAIAVCVCCQNPFGINDGIVTEEVAICDVCNGD